LIDVLSQYARDLDAVKGRLYLTGVSQEAYEQVIRSGKLRLTGPVRAHEATAIVWESTRKAHADAETWLAGQS
jgi:SulP family sulfate permease